LIEHAHRLLELFDLSKKGDSPNWQLSTGQKKKVALCFALIIEAPIMLLDEPFSGGLDPYGILMLKRLIQHLSRLKKATIVLTSPVPELVEEIATGIVVLRDGEILAFDTLDGLQLMTGHRGTLMVISVCAITTILTAPIARLLIYVPGYQSPISFWERICTFRLIIPSYDQVCAGPIYSLAGGFLVLNYVLLPIDVRYPLAGGVAVLLALISPPRLRRWRLIGQHHLGATFADQQAALVNSSRT
jgi:energy-coupling factor transporter ATP-binding protein EcfA2